MSSIITIVEDFKEFKQPITEQFYLILFDLVAQHKTHYIESLNENTNEIYELINNIFTNNGIKPITHYEFQAGFNINDVRFLLFYCFTMYLMASYSWNRTIRNDLIAVGNMMIEKKDYLPVIIEDIKIILDGLEVKTIVFNDLINNGVLYYLSDNDKKHAALIKSIDGGYSIENISSAKQHIRNCGYFKDEFDIFNYLKHGLILAEHN